MVMLLYVIRNYSVKPGVVGMAEGRREWKLQRRSLSVLLKSLAFIILLVKDNESFKQGAWLVCFSGCLGEQVEEDDLNEAAKPVKGVLKSQWESSETELGGDCKAIK